MKELWYLLAILAFAGLSVFIIQHEKRKALEIEVLRENFELMDSITKMQYETQELLWELHEALDDHIKQHHEIR